MFNASRLALARKRRQFTKKRLAEAADIAQVTLTRLEKKNTQEPERETVEALARALSYPVEFFYMGDVEEFKAESVSFRSLSSLTARQRDAALTAGDIAFMLDDWVAERFDLPAPDLLDLRDESPEGAAIALRRHWGMGSKPIPQLVKLLEAKGVRVFSLAEAHKHVDAYSIWRDGVPYVFLNTFKSAERSRFDAAHELGHLVLHLHGYPSGREAEREADRFSSAFLIPRDDLVANLPMARTLDQLVQAKKRWGVSVAALARAAFAAGVASDWHYRELCKQISRRGYRTREPRPREREESVLWPKVFAALWKERVTKSHIATELGLPPEEVESLVGGVCGTNVTPPVRTNSAARLRAV